ncbi:MAG: PDZ domain-containing protein [Acidobacteriia bacterium]|nr:PDZ domain-containing protein [Terriglobia bacterium]
MKPHRKANYAFVLVLFCTTALAQPPVDYYVSLAKMRDRLVHVRIHVAGTSAEREVQLPVWNALYQVRDFAQYVRRVTAKDATGRELPVRKLDKTTWRIYHAESGAEIEYDILADQPGPYGSQLNSEHGFFNLAELLMYPTDARDSLMTVTFTDLPRDWDVATVLPSLNPGEAARLGRFSARNYDRLVDAPVEMGRFAAIEFEDGGARYHIAVHADPADYDMNAVRETVRKTVASEVAWMNDRPFGDFLFIYHFPRNTGGGGMEHAYSTAIDVPADRLRDDPYALPSVTAHEFFHLWNVKRIRPKSLEPIDYLHENFTTALWFSEGFTNTVADYTMLRTGAWSEQQFLTALSREIYRLESRPAARIQSAEESSLDTWFDKYPQYRTAERSIDYYNKGEILGILLDLAMRDATQGGKSLRELFQWMEKNYFYEARYFDDTAGVRYAVEKVTGKDFGWFFENYVSGVTPIPYDEFFRSVGLRLDHRKAVFPDPGFVSVKNFDQPPAVYVVSPGADAERAGLVPGDIIVEINGKPATIDVESAIANMRPGDILRLKIKGRRGTRDVKIKLGGREEQNFAIVESPSVTPAQQARRAAWLRGESQSAGGTP